MDSVRTVGIIFHQKNDASFDAVQGIIRELKETGKKVSVIGYIDANFIPEFYRIRKGFHFFCKQDINWYSIPEPAFVEDFIRERFDLLIDLSIEDHFPLEYIFALSTARFKAGKFVQGSDHADLSIDIGSNRDVFYLTQQIKHYLSLINTKY